MPECPACDGPLTEVECGNLHCTVGGLHEICVTCQTEPDEWTPDTVAAVRALREHFPNGFDDGKPDWFLVASLVLDAAGPILLGEAADAVEKALDDAFRASVISGTLAVDAEEFQRRAGILLGREVQTHEFGSERLWNEMRERLGE